MGRLQVRQNAYREAERFPICAEKGGEDMKEIIISLGSAIFGVISAAGVLCSCRTRDGRWKIQCFIKQTKGVGFKFKRKLCPECKTGQDTYRLDGRSPMCPYIGCHNGNQCPMFVRMDKPEKGRASEETSLNGKRTTEK